MMSRNLERRLVYATGIWQIIDGLITILIFGTYQRQQFASVTDLPLEQLNALESIFGSLYIFISLFGVLLIGLGLINLVTARNYMKDRSTSVKTGIWLIAVGIFSYFIMDIISLVLCMSAGILFLAKNKSIKIQEASS